MDKRNLRKGVQSGLFWLLVPLGVSIGVGYGVKLFVPWLSNWTVSAFVVTVATLIGAWRVKVEEGKIAWMRILFFVLNLISLSAAGFFQWQHLRWPWSPWVGAGLLGVIWVAVLVFFAWRRGNTEEEETSPQVVTRAGSSTPSQSSLTRPATRPGEVNISHELAAAFGFPASPGATIRLKDFEAALLDSTNAKKVEANAKLAEQIRQAVKDGLIDRAHVSARLCELCGIEPPIASSQPAQPKEVKSRIQVRIRSGGETPTIRWH